MPALDFWYSIGSTYSYLTVMRIAEHCAAQGVDVVWRPFNVREIMIEQNNIPFAGKPVKSAYMWRDIERRAALYDLPVRVPAPYPLDHLPLANQVAVLGMAEGWLRYDAVHQRIELPLSLAEELAEVLEVPVMLVEVHPTHERLEVGVVHLNDHR